MREGSLEAPTRHPIDWQSEAFYDTDDLNQELERVFDICHGCRRCVSLCDAFPTLFDLVDESDTMEVDGVDKSDYMKVVDQCYLCDMCYMTKCPYVPPHEWNVDFPHLMLRAKAKHFKDEGARLRDRFMTSTDAVGSMATIPLIDITVNAANSSAPLRVALEKVAGIHRDAPVPRYESKTLKKRAPALLKDIQPDATDKTTGKVALFTTCYCNYNLPHVGEDLIKVFQHNGIEVKVVNKDKCCGMPKMELGDLESVKALKEHNIPELMQFVAQGYDLVGAVPSCVLMFKQELPLLFPDDADVQKVQAAFYDPFEYLQLRHKAGKLNTDFKTELGDISYQVACHLRVQNIGLKTRDVLKLIPGTEITTHERCSGHDGTYAVRAETRDKSVKIATPVVRKLNKEQPDYFSSDCPMAGRHLADLSDNISSAEHPMTLLRIAYGLS